MSKKTFVTASTDHSQPALAVTKVEINNRAIEVDEFEHLLQAKVNEVMALIEQRDSLYAVDAERLTIETLPKSTDLVQTAIGLSKKIGACLAEMIALSEKASETLPAGVTLEEAVPTVLPAMEAMHNKMISSLEIVNAYDLRFDRTISEFRAHVASLAVKLPIERVATGTETCRVTSDLS